MINQGLGSILLNYEQIEQIIIAPTWGQISHQEQQLKQAIGDQWTYAMYFEHFDDLIKLKKRLWQALLNNHINIEKLTFEQWKLMMLGASDLVYPILIIDQSHFQTWKIFKINTIDHIFSAIDFVCQSPHFVVLYQDHYDPELHYHFVFLKDLFTKYLKQPELKQSTIYQQKQLLASLKQKLIASNNQVQLLLEKNAKWN